MSPTSYLAALPRDILLVAVDEMLLTTQDSLYIILKNNSFVNYFFAFFKKIYEKSKKIYSVKKFFIVKRIAPHCCLGSGDEIRTYDLSGMNRSL